MDVSNPPPKPLAFTSTNGFFFQLRFYIFDTLPIFICFVIFNILHPGKYLQNLGFRGGRSDIWADEGTRERMDMAGDVDLETTDAQEEGNKR